MRNALENNNIQTAKKQRCRNLKWETDPVTDAEFEYKRIGDFKFEICGVFAREGNANSGRTRPIYNANTRNVLDTKIPRKSAGRHCYLTQNWTNK